jgi:threonine dehydrogenase-like Zn-dependent dehydrogenase
MSDTMQAVVCHAPHDYRVEQVPIPVVGPGEILLRVGACGICASDIKCYGGAPHFWGTGARPKYVIEPVIPGHEFSGTIEHIDPALTQDQGLQVGDLVVAEQIVPCWRCRYCTHGQYWLCQVHNIFGFKGGICDGGMAEFVKVPPGAIVHKVPEGLTKQQAAYVEPLSCALHAVERAEIKVGDTVVVAGLGNIGMCMLQAARLHTPGVLIGIDRYPNRRALAKQLGADLVLDPVADRGVEAVRDLTDGYGCDVYIEATGHPSGVVQGLEMVRKAGTFVEFSVFAEPVTADWTIVGDRKELNIRGAHLGPYLYPLAMRLLQEKRITVDPLITHQFALADFPTAMSTAHQGAHALKVMLVP